jgi:flagellar protein FliO/FliZ
MSAGMAVLACLLLAPAALAADGESTRLDLPSAQPAGDAAAPAAGGGMVRTIVGLAIVLAVIYGLYWVLKQVKASKHDRASGSGLQALATLPLGGNRSMQLVRAGQEIVLVGVGETGVSHIRTYTEAEARALGLLPPEDDDLGGTGSGTPLGLGAGTAKPTARGFFTRFVEELRSRTVIR